MVSVILGEAGFADVIVEDFVSGRTWMWLEAVVVRPRSHICVFNMNQMAAKNKLVDSVSKLCGQS